MAIARKEPGTQVRAAIAAWCLEKHGVGSREAEMQMTRSPVVTGVPSWLLSMGGLARESMPRFQRGDHLLGLGSADILTWGSKEGSLLTAGVALGTVPFIAFIKWIHLSLSPKSKCFHSAD